MTHYQAGFQTFQTRDEDGVMPCAVWYPTSADEKQLDQGVYRFSIAAKASIATGRFPLVVMSHGSGGTRFGHCKTAEFLAREGYMVLSFDHPHNNFFDNRAVGTAASYAGRSRHVQTALNALLDHDLGSSVDHDRMAVFGFSLGGFTALCSVGAQPDVAGLRRHLRQNREYDANFCRLEVIVQQGYTRDDLEVTPEPRFRACIALAPVSGGLFTGQALAKVSVPVLLYRAMRDRLLQHPFHATEIRDHLPQGCLYRETPLAGHFAYLSPVRPEMRASLGEIMEDPAGFERWAVHQAMHQDILAFLVKTLS